MTITREDVENADKYAKYDSALKDQIASNAKFEEDHKARHEAFMVEKKARDEKKFRLGAQLAIAGRALEKIEFEVDPVVRRELQEAEFGLAEAGRRGVEVENLLRDLRRSVATLKKNGLTKEQAHNTIDSLKEVEARFVVHKTEVKKLAARVERARGDYKTAYAAVKKAAYGPQSVSKA